MSTATTIMCFKVEGKGRYACTIEASIAEFIACQESPKGGIHRRCIGLSQGRVVGSQMWSGPPTIRALLPGPNFEVDPMASSQIVEEQEVS